MRESDFVKQNKTNWADFEKEWVKPDPRPEKIAKHYIEIVDDLSYARTHYGSRLVRSYLNGAAENLSIKIHRSRKQYWVNFKKFWKTDLPLIMFDGRKQFLLAFLIFALAVGIGIISTIHDKEFAASILGEDYIELTKKNIKNGDPMGIYKSSEATPMFFRITFNNTFIAARTFVLSLFVGFGTVVVLVYNGIMVGVFQYFFIEQDLFFESFLAIWQHGIVEISCIILAGAAGLVLAKGILFPGSYSRIDSFRLAGRKGLIMMLGILPLLIYSGAIESWVTRYTDVHWSLRLTSILLSLTFVIYYFIIYPRKVSRRREMHDVLRVVKIPLQSSDFEFKTIQRNMSVWWKSIQILLRKPWRLVLICLSLGIVVYIFSTIFKQTLLAGGIFWLIPSNGKTLAMITLFICTTVALITIKIWMNEKLKVVNSISSSRYTFGNTLLIPILIGAFTSLLFTNGWLIVLWFFLIPVFGSVFSTQINQPNENFVSAIRNSNKLMKISYGRFIQLLLISAFSFFLLNGIITILFNLFIFQILGDLVIGDQYFINQLWTNIQILLSTAIIFGFVITLFLAYVLSHHTISEIESAEVLKNKIQDSFQVNKLEKKQKVELLRKEVFQAT